MTCSTKAVVLGAYGLIGAACVHALQRRGFTVTGVGRSRRAAHRSDAVLDWVICDIAEASTADWLDIFAGASVIVNASGALQDGALDNLARIHIDALAAMLPAAEAVSARFIHISAAGASEAASTPFFRTKAHGDRLVHSAALDWIILRPVLVIGPQAYGGTALLRASAAMPVAGLLISPDAPVQTVSLTDAADAVADAADGRIAPGTVADLTEPAPQTLAEVTNTLRAWQGFPPWRWTLTVPPPVAGAAGLLADALGWLGWRPPMRTNALRVLADGITGDAAAWGRAGGRPCRPLAQTLAELPSTAQERWFARLFLVLPAAIACLSLFWLVSGILGLVYFERAEAVLQASGLPDVPTAALVGGGAVIDILLGLAAMTRRWCRRACLGMIAVSAAYLAGGMLWAPALWADPLGPLLKVFPGMVLALTVAAIVDER